MKLDAALKTYIAESREQLEVIEDGLLRLEQESDREETVNAVFRGMHTIKGSAGLFALDGIVAFTHVVENALDRLRDGRLEVSGDLIAVLLSCRDHVVVLIDNVEQARAPDSETVAAGEQLLDDLRARMGVGADAAVPQKAAVDARAAAITIPAGDAVASDHWHISLRFGSEVLRNGMDPLSFLRYLKSKGEILHISALTERLPAADAMDPEACYFGYEIAYRTTLDKAGIEGAFEFVRDDCTVHILPPRSRIGEYVQLLHAQADEQMRLGEILVQCGSLTPNELADALAQQHRAPAGKPLGQLLVEQGSVHPSVVEAALDKQRQTRDTRSAESKSVRVDADKLDQLIDLIGELVIAGAGAGTAAQSAGVTSVIEALSGLQHLVSEVRDNALSLRMVQIGSTFNRFQRVVRDVSRELGKEIDLVISGADTELDKTVVEKIGDPLMHLVRNAMDHGIETAGQRVHNGKPARGTLRLNAHHDSGSIVIEVSDDGRGLNRERILAKAIEKGIVAASQSLSDAEIYNLIFEPGFSTADQVSNLSGRGVGMDVVRRNITALRGTIDIEVRPGHGTTIRVRLPLTLAIIDGFRVGVGTASFVLPLESVEECIELNTVEVGTDRNFINLRGEVLSFVRLREMFGIATEQGRRENLVVVQQGKRRFGIVVDRLLGELQSVIKPLAGMFSHVKGLGGSTILGSGEVALILDVASLMQHAVNVESQAVSAGPSVRMAAAR